MDNVDVSKITPRDILGVLGRLTLGSYISVFGFITSVFLLGAWSASFFSKDHPNLPTRTEATPNTQMQSNQSASPSTPETTRVPINPIFNTPVPSASEVITSPSSQLLRLREQRNLQIIPAELGGKALSYLPTNSCAFVPSAYWKEEDRNDLFFTPLYQGLTLTSIGDQAFLEVHRTQTEFYFVGYVTPADQGRASSHESNTEINLYPRYRDGLVLTTVDPRSVKRINTRLVYFDSIRSMNVTDINFR